ncbi:PAS domain-containing protein [Jannaschia sp. KMU-145]|uniref:PAS domain-containing protein n=1 Tax=Jannaschia halovivens TaxID=3388667 RepID=UPI00396B07F7
MAPDREFPAHGTAQPEANRARASGGSGGRKLAAVMEDSAALEGFSRVRVAVVLADARAEDQPIVYVNSAFERTTGYSRSAAIGRNCRFLQGEDTDKDAVDRIRHAVADGRDVTVDLLNYRADGSPFMNRLIIAPISDSNGEPIFFLGIQKEIYASEAEEEHAHGLLRMLHERVQGDLAMVLKQLGQEVTGYDTRAAEDMNRRLECLQLAYEGMQLADRQQDIHPGIDLGSLLSRAAAAIAHHEGRPGIRYVQDIDPIDVNLDAAVRISLLMSEVLSNAFRHAFERVDEGVVELRMTKLAAGGLRLTIGDDGVGLPANEPFPNPETVGGRLMATLLDGLEATLTPVRGAAGTVVMIDVPVDIVEL